MDRTCARAVPSRAAGHNDHGQQVPIHSRSHHPRKGSTVTLQLTSSDRVHGFMIRTLKIDTDVQPGKVTAITVMPQIASTFTAICDHYAALVTAT
jgi:Cytochrome C oxidase subunit II, periplasmic domain